MPLESNEVSLAEVLLFARRSSISNDTLQNGCAVTVAAIQP